MLVIKLMKEIHWTLYSLNVRDSWQAFRSFQKFMLGRHLLGHFFWEPTFRKFALDCSWNLKLLVLSSEVGEAEMTSSQLISEKFQVVEAWSFWRTFPSEAYMGLTDQGRILSLEVDWNLVSLASASGKLRSMANGLWICLLTAFLHISFTSADTNSQDGISALLFSLN